MHPGLPMSVSRPSLALSGVLRLLAFLYWVSSAKHSEEKMGNENTWSVPNRQRRAAPYVGAHSPDAETDTQRQDTHTDRRASTQTHRKKTLVIYQHAHVCLRFV